MDFGLNAQGNWFWCMKEIVLLPQMTWKEDNINIMDPNLELDRKGYTHKERGSYKSFNL